MARLPYADLKHPEAAPLVQRIVAERGHVLHLYQMLLHSPPLAEGWLTYLTAVRQKLGISGALRELMEETGLGEDEVEYVSEHPEWLVYEWPLEVQRAKGGIHSRIGQAQRWFTFHARSADIVPTPDGSEFIAWKWVDPEWLIDHVPGWRRGPYQIVLGQHPRPHEGHKPAEPAPPHEGQA
jgi:8-oxo-dGTP pyrophosphatase MutT (NUDIX family)